MTPEEVVKVLADRQSRLLKMRKDFRLMEAAWVHYSTHPVDFINDWLVTYDPRVQPSLMPFMLFPKQADYINWLYDRYKNKEDGLVEKSRDMGVTWLCCAFAAWMWLFVRGSSVSFGSRKEDLVDKLGDPDSIFEKIRIILDNLPVEFLPRDYNPKIHASHMKFLNPANGSNIKGEAGDNIGRGGRSSVYFKDESAFYERPEKVEAALSMNSDVKIDVSTPNGNGNPFFRKRHSGKIPVFTFHWKDDPRKDAKWYQKQKDLLDPVILAQEVDIDYNASVGNVLIPADHVRTGMDNRASEIFDGEGGNNAPLILGVDVARFGDDRTVLALRRGRHLLWFATVPPCDNVGIVGEIMNCSTEYPLDAIFVDVVGIGAGVFDMLNHKLSYVYAVNGGSSPFDKAKYMNRRAEMWGRMREWLKDAPVILPKSQEMMTDLCSLQYSFNANGQLVLEKKEDAKKRGVRSPDIADAIALTFAEHVTHRVDAEENQTDRTRSSLTGY